jgi:NTP pyrophosphatase (non-canonical NTP hydrolase)
MKESMSIKALQAYIKQKDFRPEYRQAYFFKLVEEVGELSEVIRKDLRMDESQNIKGTIEEELYDVLYYTILLLIYDIDLEQCHYLKDELNLKKYGSISTKG